MLRLVSIVSQATVLLLAGYNAITALWGWKDRPPSHGSGPARRLRVVVPAHDEAHVLGAILGDLASVDYPGDRFETWVIADRCQDDTASVARAHGANVEERSEGVGGKGAALSWFLEQRPLDDDETIVVLDADNKIPDHMLRRISEELSAGHPAIQCYLDVSNAERSLLTEAGALSYWASNRMVQLARANLGWAADLGGTGMAVTAGALEVAGGFAPSLTEDQDLGVRLLLSGYPVHWIHDVRVEDEKPAGLGATMRQRARWMAGKRASRKEHLGALLRNPSPANLDMAVRLVQPGRSFVALLSAVLTTVAATTGSSLLLPWPVWAGATAVQVLEPLPFLAKEGVPARQLARYPLLAILAALWVPVRLISSHITRWYHTPHEGSNPIEPVEEAR